MATYILTAGNDNIIGTSVADIFDGYFNGTPGGSDELSGGLGNDRFVLGSIEYYYTVDGGDGIDTVHAQGTDFGYASFSNVEILDVRSGAISVTPTQLAAFAAVTNSERPGDRIDVFGVADTFLNPPYLVFDFSTRVTGAYSVNFRPGGDAVLAYSIVGTANADILEGWGKADIIDGAGGSDIIRGDGYDKLYGGGGDDRFELSLRSGSGVVDGGAGVDTLVTIADGLNSYFDLNAMTVSGVEILNTSVPIWMTVTQFYSFKSIVDFNNAKSEIELYFSDISGSSVNLSSRIAGGHSARASVTNGTLIGTASNDHLTAGSGNEVLMGGDGNDLLANGGWVLSGIGNDILNGGAGNDRFELFGAKGVVYGGTGYDTVVASGGTESLKYFTFKDVETLDADGNHLAATLSQLSSFSKIVSSNAPLPQIIFFLTGSGGAIDFSNKVTGQLSVWVQSQNNSSAFNIVGTANGDRLEGTSHNDTLKGGNGADVLQGSDGNDRLTGGAGQDQLDGGAGNDVYELENGFDAVSDFAGTDTITTTIGRDLMKYAAIENLVLYGAAAINGNGNTLNNAMYGNTAANWLSGGNGNDVLYGGAGKDTLTGGAGYDFFIFNTALNASTNVDVIRDFNVAQDTIRLDNAVMSGLGTTLGTLASGKFWKSTSGLAHDADDRIIYETDTGKLFYDANGKASGGAVQIATLAANLALTNADFVVI